MNIDEGMAGLGESVPLVTLSNSTISHGISVPAGDNHPLAPPTRSISNSSNNSQNNNDRSSSSSKSTKIVPTAASPQSKSLDALADSFLKGSSYRTGTLGLAPLMGPIPLPHYAEGIQRLRTLVERRAWGDVLKLSSNMLTTNTMFADIYASLATNAPQEQAMAFAEPQRRETVEILTLRCHAWLKLRRYRELSEEIERWNFIAQNDATAESPTWLPWSLHILAAQSLEYTDDPKRASDVLFELRERIPPTDKVWQSSVDIALSNVFLRQNEWRLALGSLDRMLEAVPLAVEHEVNIYKFSDESKQILTAAYNCEILSRQGRIFLQCGALPEATTQFSVARTEWAAIVSSIDISGTQVAKHRLIQLIPALLETNEGLVCFAEKNFEQATEYFQRAVDSLRSCGRLEPEYYVEDWMGPAVAGCQGQYELFSECCNNLSISALYTCRMTDAVNYLEALVRENPTAFLTERVAFNLCTLYELGSDSAASARRKRVLQLIAKRFFLHDVGPESFRVN